MAGERLGKQYGRHAIDFEFGLTVGKVSLTACLITERTVCDQDDIDSTLAGNRVNRLGDMRGVREIGHDGLHARPCATRPQVGRDALEPFGIPPEQGEILRLTLRPEARAMRGHRRGRANNHDSLCVLHFMLQEVCVTSPN